MRQLVEQGSCLVQVSINMSESYTFLANCICHTQLRFGCKILADIHEFHSVVMCICMDHADPCHFKPSWILVSVAGKLIRDKRKGYDLMATIWLCSDNDICNRPQG